jgi:hypothetical protein
MEYKTNIENINLDEVYFANDVLDKFDSHEYESLGTEVCSVDLSKVVGCYHPDYAGKTWGELKPVEGTLNGDREIINIAYQNLKRAIGNVRDLSRNPDYYLNKEVKDHWDFYNLEGKLYISSGVHRTIIGRYFLWLNDLEPLVHGVHLTHLKPKSNIVAQDMGRGQISLFDKLKSILTQHNKANALGLSKASLCSVFPAGDLWRWAPI